MDMKTTKRDFDHLSLEEVEAFGQELDALRDRVRADLGQRDADYIRQMVSKQQWCEVSGRGLIHTGLSPLSWSAGVGLLTVAKILENMEIGHNVMHGQYDWMNDPDFYSQTYEWDTVCDGDSWRKTHNYEHHTYTNILGKDRDYGYAVLRLSDEEPWRLRHLFQFGNLAVLTLLFEWGVGLHELEVEKIRSGEISWKDKVPFLKRFGKKAARQVAKDYLFFPALAGPLAPKVAAGNLLANLGRNVWAATIIFCGHFTEDSQTFSQDACADETRGAWYRRQLLGSGNFTGAPWLHTLSGHLSYQIEHHLFPDIPAHRYPEMAPEVEAICARYGLPYNTGSFGAQIKSVLKQVGRHSLPPGGSFPRFGFRRKAQQAT